VKIIVSNTVTLNGGDAAILHAVVKMIHLAYPDAEVAVYDSQPDVAAKYHNHWTFRRLMYDATRKRLVPPVARTRLMKAAKMLAAGNEAGARVVCPSDIWASLLEYRDADLVASTGGTYLVEHYDIRHRLFDFELCRVLDTPLVFFTQSLGPFENPVNVRDVRNAFTRAPFALMRDQRSFDHLVDIGVPPDNLVVCADSVFALAEDDTVKAAISRRLPARGLKVAVSVRHWTHFASRTPEEGMNQYRRSIAAVVSRLVRHYDATVTFVSTCQGIEEYWTHDTETADEIVALLAADVRDAVTVDYDFHDPLDLRDDLAGYDMVVATRMHAAILSLIAGTAVLPVAYEFKTTELFDVLGAPELVLDIDDMTPQASLATLELFLDRFDDDYRAGVFEAVLGEKARALRGVELLQALEL
jgi:colanic acid/amylovoran biosynthesis protein